MNTIYDIEATNPTIINAFRKISFLTSNLLIHSDKKASKIYQGSEKVKPSIQELFNFWPPDNDKLKEDRKMLLL